jgi:uncharacterized small protein (DUF1192 family)
MSTLNEYLEREASKKNLQKRVEDKDISLEEAYYYCKELKLTEAEMEEMFEANFLKQLGRGIVRGAKDINKRYIQGDKAGADTDKLNYMQQDAEEAATEGPSLGQRFKAGLDYTKQKGSVGLLKNAADQATAAATKGIAKQKEVINGATLKLKNATDPKSVAALQAQIATANSEIKKLTAEQNKATRAYQTASKKFQKAPTITGRAQAAQAKEFGEKYGAGSHGKIAQVLSQRASNLLAQATKTLANNSQNIKSIADVDKYFTAFEQEVAKIKDQYKADYKARGGV